MSRSIDQGERDRVRNSDPGKGQSSGRGGGASGGTGTDSGAELAQIIDQVAADKPTMSEFVRRLEQRGVQAVPSIQASGRLNGFSFRWNNQTIRGSSLGRAYTAQGLQDRKGVRYEHELDHETLLRAADRAGLQRADRQEPRICGEREPGREETPERQERTRDRNLGLSPDQAGTLGEIGKFRTVGVNDLIHFRYAGRANNFARDARILDSQGLLERRTIQHKRTGKVYEVAVLTRRGRNLARKLFHSSINQSKQQTFYAGFVKPAEARHDAGIYRMYQAEAQLIHQAGGTVQRVVLDYELKKDVYAALNKRDEPDPQKAAGEREQIAYENQLQLVDGKFVFPDLRIEYETRDQDQDKVDLELASDHYKDSQVQQKRAAGLKIYAPDNTPRSPALQDPEIVAGLISL